MAKLTAGHLHMLNLIVRDRDNEGWTRVSKQVMPLFTKPITQFPLELVELEGPFESGGGRVRLTERGEQIVNVQGYFV